jgi:hypothetical protein
MRTAFHARTVRLILELKNLRLAQGGADGVGAELRYSSGSEGAGPVSETAPTSFVGVPMPGARDLFFAFDIAEVEGHVALFSPVNEAINKTVVIVYLPDSRPKAFSAGF